MDMQAPKKEESKTLLFCEQKRSKKNFVNLDRAVEIASG
jgi:hypothetical protein